MENRSQNGLRHSSVVRIEKGQSGKREGDRDGARGERSIQQSLSTHLCEAVCANLTSPATPLALAPFSLPRRCDALYVGYDDSRGYALG